MRWILTSGQRVLSRKLYSIAAIFKQSDAFYELLMEKRKFLYL